MKRLLLTIAISFASLPAVASDFVFTTIDRGFVFTSIDKLPDVKKVCTNPVCECGANCECSLVCACEVAKADRQAELRDIELERIANQARRQSAAKKIKPVINRRSVSPIRVRPQPVRSFAFSGG